VFEEVDMLLDEDKGFVGAVVNLLQSTQVFLMCCQCVANVLLMCRGQPLASNPGVSIVLLMCF
jgi:hypothetical protein